MANVSNKSKDNHGVLLLSHCGFSFMEDLIKNINELGFQSYIVSSKPLPGNEYRINELKKIATEVFITNDNDLNIGEVTNVISQLEINGNHVIACISVWEGYRYLMSMVNNLVGIPDIDKTKVDLLLDKYELRNILRKLNLSSVNVKLLTPDILNENNNGSKFIKPRHGLASYGAFKVTSQTTWKQIEIIREEMQADIEYRNIFTFNQDFVIEDYIPGIEFSFEIIAANCVPYIIAIHEKYEIEECALTTLENACISPPISLSDSEVIIASKWINEIFSKLGLNHGCFHLEAKYYNKQWEIIEINPRVGGAYISHSTELTSGHNLLSLWLQVLLSHNWLEYSSITHLLHSLNMAMQDSNQKKTSTFFKVYFAPLNKTVANVKMNDLKPQPYLSKIFVSNTLANSNSSKEVFLAQALWKINDCTPKQIKQIASVANRLMEICCV